MDYVVTNYTPSISVIQRLKLSNSLKVDHVDSPVDDANDQFFGTAL